MTKLSLVLKPQRPALLRDKKQTIDVMIALQAPDAPAEHSKSRKPLHLGIVIDRSGSMNGRPLEEAKRCAAMVVNKLRDTDRVAIVDYDDTATVRAEVQEASNRLNLVNTLLDITAGGCTNLHLGWLTGAERIAPEVTPTTVSRVMILSDGMANRGLLDRDKIYDQCQELAKAGVSTSTYGLGNNFDESLMTGMAKAGHGNAYYGQSADDLMDPFEEEIAYLENLCARKVRIQYELADHISAEVLNPGCLLPDGSIALQDIAYQSEGWAILRLTVAQTATISSDTSATVPLLSAKATYETVDGVKIEVQIPVLRVPLLNPDEYSNVAVDAVVTTRLAQLELARLEHLARQAARRQDWAEVEQLLNVAQRDTVASEWAQRTVKTLRNLFQMRDQEKLSKELAYSAMRKERSSSLRSNGVFGERAGIGPAYVREKSSQGKADPKQCT